MERSKFPMRGAVIVAAIVVTITRWRRQPQRGVRPQRRNRRLERLSSASTRRPDSLWIRSL